jgi:serine/threonine-protein kinase
MAAVYAARVVGEGSFQKRVALKVMLPHLSRDAKFEKMFGDEARLAAQIVSPYVVGTIDLGRDKTEGLYQVMELVLGCSLRQMLDGAAEPLPLDVALTLVAQVARGLADAHAARGDDGKPLNVVHRDVSPHNVLVGTDGRARLSDFGVARAAAIVSSTESGELKGKLAYASPEQLGGEVADARSDVFALGIVAWEVIANRRLFQAENPLALVDAMLARPIPSVREARPDASEEVAALVASALVRDRGERKVNASELAAGLEEAARAAGGVASPERIGALVRERGGAALAEVEESLRQPLPARSTPPPAASTSGSAGIGARPVIALVAIAAVIGVAWIAWRSSVGEPEAAPSVAAAPPLASAVPASEVDVSDGEVEVPAREVPASVVAPPASEAPTAATAAAPSRAETDPASSAIPRGPRPRPSVVSPPTTTPLVTTAPATAVPPPTAAPPPSAPPPSAPPASGLLGVEDFDRDDPR